jgi:NAD(P)-dependent dehydrogenase (short-subunit alcohol dehydrogenase family)
MRSDLFDLTGKVALVTGSHRGIGYAIAEEMGRAGASLCVCSNEPDGVAKAVSLLEANGTRAIGVACDLGVDGDLDRLVAESEKAFGRIDILVCNAGINPHFGPMVDATEEEYETIMRINLRANIELAKRVAPGMVARRDGSIIMMSSLSGLRGHSKIGLYAITKAALAQHARNLAVEYGPFNVRVNAISPGVVRTSFVTPLLEDEEALARRVGSIPLRRLGEAREVAGAAVFLASPAGAYVNGHNLVLDGGTLITSE